MKMKYKFCGETNYADGSLFTTTRSAPPAPVWRNVTDVTFWSGYTPTWNGSGDWSGDYLSTGYLTASELDQYGVGVTWNIMYRPKNVRLTFTGNITFAINDWNGFEIMAPVQIVSGQIYPLTFFTPDAGLVINTAHPDGWNPNDLYTLVINSVGFSAWNITKIELGG